MSAAVDRLVEVVRLLREHCLWTAALTHASLVEYLVEESYELVEAIEDEQPEGELKGELADVLLQVVLHSEIARERGAFDFDAVAEALTAKMVRRNRHVFTADGGLQLSFPATVEEIIASWDAAKREEKEALAASAARDDVLPSHLAPAGGEASDAVEGLPRHLPALALADKALGRAERRRALDGPTSASLGPTSASLGPTSASLGPISAEFATEDDLGELLLAVVRVARSKGLDAERALRSAVRRLPA
ncbi:MazG nucleotide pyrophosphohydrolase domain-containing protein [Sinomonas sp. ASV322]|uniref:MazG nucleotide pyrophosphohydrolase domain-containing protein n=1 Tax=Sinomonas sp. ASV322 TaxID=3041920 RepID=UPI0027DB6A9B|nr:MazG nucleotide pyrophosphohydrolase domain-containing protein [Sinomonas sp. ASV322]MDQ4503637.1 MazG nucleotide pyrophosphohydrolase domain-containing protein [Sinomonas sp. ASV322]